MPYGVSRGGAAPASFRVPPLWCPLPSAIHPGWRALNEKSNAWAVRFGIYPEERQLKRLFQASVGELTGRVMPRAVNNDALQVASDTAMWLFAFDDVHCDEGALKNRINDLAVFFMRCARASNAVSRDHSGGTEPYAASLADLRRRLSACATPGQVVRWEGAVLEYLFAEIGLAAYRQLCVIPSVNDYISIRMGSGGVQLIAALLDVADGVEVASAELYRPEVRALTEQTITMVTWDNDIFSHRKETVRSGDGQNLVDILAAQRGLPLERALTEAVAMRDRVLARYLELRDQVARGASAELLRYLANCDSWIRGNIDWSMACDRYINAEDGTDLPDVTAAFPSCLDPDPLPFPAISWWWTAGTPVTRPCPERPQEK